MDEVANLKRRVQTLESLLAGMSVQKVLSNVWGFKPQMHIELPARLVVPYGSSDYNNIDLTIWEAKVDGYIKDQIIIYIRDGQIVGTVAPVEVPANLKKIEIHGGF